MAGLRRRERASAAAGAGADVLFVEAPSEAEIEALPRRLDRPLLFNYAPSGRTPLVPFARLRERSGTPSSSCRSTSCSPRRGWRSCSPTSATRTRRRDPERLVSFQEFCDLIGLPASSPSASDTDPPVAAPGPLTAAADSAF